MQNEPQLSAEMEERFDEEFAVQKHSWGDTFAWADSSDDEPNRIKHFLATALEKQKKEILAEVESWLVNDDEILFTDAGDVKVSWVHEIRNRLRDKLRAKLAQMKEEL